MYLWNTDYIMKIVVTEHRENSKYSLQLLGGVTLWPYRLWTGRTDKKYTLLNGEVVKANYHICSLKNVPFQLFSTVIKNQYAMRFHLFIGFSKYENIRQKVEESLKNFRKNFYKFWRKSKKITFNIQEYLKRFLEKL